MPFETAAAAAGDVMGRARQFLPSERQSHSDAHPQMPLVHEDSTQMRAADHREQPEAVQLDALQDDSASAAESEAQADPVQASVISSSGAELPTHQHARLQPDAAEDGRAGEAAAAAEDDVHPEPCTEPAPPTFEPWPAPSPSMASSVDVRPSHAAALLQRQLPVAPACRICLAGCMSRADLYCTCMHA